MHILYLLVLYFNDKTFTVDHLVTPSKLMGHRRRSSVNFGGGNAFLPEIMYEKITKCWNFTWYLPKKLTKYRDMDTVSKKKYLTDHSDVIFEVPKCSKIQIFRGSAPDPTDGAYSAYCSPDLLAGGKGTRHLPEICPNFTLRLAEKYFFGIFLFFLGGGQPLVRGWAPGPPPAKSGPESITNSKLLKSR